MIKTIKKNEYNDMANVKSKENTSNIEIYTEKGIFTESFYFRNEFDDAKMKKFIKSCETMIRSSNEYKEYIGFLNKDLGITNCAILGNVSKNFATVEFHHYPFTLYDIVNLTVRKNIIEGKKFTSFLIAEEVLKDHFDNLICLVPLSKTVHQLVHDNKIFINLNQIYGNLEGFINKFESVMDEDMITKFKKIYEMSENNTCYSEDDILKLRNFDNENIVVLEEPKETRVENNMIITDFDDNDFDF